MKKSIIDRILVSIFPRLGFIEFIVIGFLVYFAFKTEFRFTMIVSFVLGVLGELYLFLEREDMRGAI